MIFNESGTAALAGSDQSGTGTFALIQIKSTFTYAFGDLATALKANATTWKIGEPSNSATAGSHSGRINIDGATAASTFLIYGTKGSSTDTGLEPVRIKAGSASAKAVIYSGRVGFATNTPADTGTIGTISVQGSDAVANIASGNTLTTLNVTAGTANLSCAATTVNVNGGTLYTYGSGAITTVNVNGTADLRSTGTITTLNIMDGGSVTLLNDNLAKTITTINLYKGASLSYDPAIVTVTNAINLISADLSDVTITIPQKTTRTITIA